MVQTVWFNSVAPNNIANNNHAINGHTNNLDPVDPVTAHINAVMIRGTKVHIAAILLSLQPYWIIHNTKNATTAAYMVLTPHVGNDPTCFDANTHDIPRAMVIQNHTMPNTHAGGRKTTERPAFLPIGHTADAVKHAIIGSNKTIHSRIVNIVLFYII